MPASGRWSPQLRLCRWFVFPTLQTAPEAPHRVAARPGAAVREGRGGTLPTGLPPPTLLGRLHPRWPGMPRRRLPQRTCAGRTSPSPGPESHRRLAFRAIPVLRIWPFRGGFLWDVSRHGTDLRQILHLVSVMDVGADTGDKNQAVLDPRAVAAPGLQAACPAPTCVPSSPADRLCAK